jgi:ParB family transcriptional regulator, chromosome partitioning protein
MMARRMGLGKGLDALIPGGESSRVEAGIESITIEKIAMNPRQPRTTLNPDDLAELAESIKEHGILQPLIVSKDAQPDHFTLVAGERRLRAAMLAGLQTVPAIVRQVTDQEQLELALIENVQRTDLAPLETAEAYKQLNEEFGLSHEEIAQQVGKSRTSVTNTLRLLKLPLPVRTALAEGQITEGHARALLALASVQAQNAALQTVLRESLSVRQTEELVQRLSGDRAISLPRNENARQPEIIAIEERLRNHLGTRVNLLHGKKSGRLVIHYYSEEELNSIIAQILKE